MNPDSDFALAQRVASLLEGKFWQITVGEWWVVVEGVSSQKLVVLTNDPLGIAFSPKDMSIGVEELKMRVIRYLYTAGMICEDGSWAAAA